MTLKLRYQFCSIRFNESHLLPPAITITIVVSSTRKPERRDSFILCCTEISTERGYSEMQLGPSSHRVGACLPTVTKVDSEKTPLVFLMSSDFVSKGFNTHLIIKVKNISYLRETHLSTYKERNSYLQYSHFDNNLLVRSTSCVSCKAGQDIHQLQSI